jgi:flavin-dependent dehydrogenase
VRRLHLEGPESAVLDLETHAPCVMLVRRVEFDHALVRAAEAAGARRLDGFEITQAAMDAEGVTLQARDGRRLRAPVVIAADGVHSVIGKRLGINRRWPRQSLAIDMMEETPVETLRAARPDVLWVAYAHESLDGYAYIFPKTHHVNVGIGCLLSHFDAHVDEAPYVLQERFVDSLTRRGALAGRSDRGCFTPFLIPVGGPLGRTAHGRVLFAGDAGGFVNAITAEGIYYAMVSGQIAGEAAAAAVRRHAPAAAGRAYERAWKKEIGAELRDAVLVQRYLFRHHARVAHVIAGASRSTALTEAILDYTRGDLSYGALKRRLLWRFPRTMFRMARERPPAEPVAAS